MMKDPEEQAIQAELDHISKNIDMILHRIENLDPATREDTSENKD